VIKEGRRHGETDWLGRDGFHRVKHEAQFLRSTSHSIAALPRIITTFRANDCFYLVVEPVVGRSLQQIIGGRERISTRRLLEYSANMARIVADIHAAGWAWRDCKPANFMCQKNRKLLALDFEGACPLHDPDPLWWGTPGYAPSQRRRKTCDLEASDLYALGTSIIQLIARNDSPTKLTVAFQRGTKKRNLPSRFVKTIQSLRSAKTKTRPSARAIQRVLHSVFSGKACSNSVPRRRDSVANGRASPSRAK
jgi:serine/threonine protein kinase